MTTQLSATPAMRARVMIENRDRMTFDERATMPLLYDEAKIMATGSHVPVQHNFGLQIMMSRAMYMDDAKSSACWREVAEIINAIPPRDRPCGVLQFFLDNTINGDDVNWATNALRIARQSVKSRCRIVDEPQRLAA